MQKRFCRFRQERNRSATRPSRKSTRLWSDLESACFLGVKESDTSVYVLLYMLDRGESEVTGSAAVCAAEYAADLV